MSQDDQAVNEPVETQETTTPDSAPEETKEPEAVDDALLAEWSDDESPEADKESVEENAEEAPAETPEAEEQPGEEKPLTPKSENRFQKLANENRELRQQIEQFNSQFYAPQTTEELIEEGLSPELAEVRALKQELEVKAYNDRVVEAQTSLSNQAEQVIKDFSMFNPESEDFDEAIADQAAALLEASLIKDPNTGMVIGSHVSPYQIYKPIADAYQKSRLQGEIQGQKAAERQLSAVDAPSSVTPKETKKDPLIELWESD